MRKSSFILSGGRSIRSPGSAQPPASHARSIVSSIYGQRIRILPYRQFSSSSVIESNSEVVLTAAEREWLQEEDTSSNISPYLKTSGGPRFDWRLKAPSRTGPLLTVAGAEVRKRRRYPKRVQPPLVGVALGEPFYGEVQAYKNHFLPLLDLEQAEDEAILKERLSSWSLDRLKEEGYCLTGLSAFWLQAHQFGRPVASFSLGPGITLPDHRFENGTQVLLTRIDPLKEEPVKGSVVSHTTTQVRVSFPELFDFDKDDKEDKEPWSWRLDVGHTNIVYERMRTAINYLNHNTLAQELEIDPSASARQLILQGTQLRDSLLRSFAPPDSCARDTHALQKTKNSGAFNEDMRIHSWAMRYSQVDPVRVEGDPALFGLNETQVRAVAMMINERISLVQGPPGTGKTKTIIETVKLLKVHFQIVHPILVCTYTNVAVDNLVEGLVAAGVKPLRVGYGGKVKSSLYEHTLDSKLESHPLRAEVDELIAEEERLRKRLVDLRKKIFNTTTPGHAVRSKHLHLLSMEAAASHLDRRLKTLNAKIYALRLEMLHDIVSAADVVCTTCVTSPCVALNVIDFPVVFLDEASMSTEPGSLIPLMKGSQHVALIGDHKQLPPVITSPEAQSKGLGISLFERLTKEGHIPSIMLDIQYRMHPAISRFPSSEFYQLSLQDGTVDSTGYIHPRLLPPASSHLETDPMTGNRPSVIFLDHVGCETSKDRSRVNWTEANIVCSVVEDLLLQNEVLQGDDIGIIAPYAAQISLLTRLFRTDHRYHERFKAVLGQQRAMQLANVEIKTVDGFEGREKEIIIFSTVRNNSAGYIGFLADRRRLNVGLTRAKRGLFVVGSLNTLKMGKSSGRDEYGNARVGQGAEAWRRYAQFLHDEGLVVRLTGERLRKTLYGNISDPNLIGLVTY